MIHVVALPTSQETLSRASGFIGVISKITPHACAVEACYPVMAENEAFTQVLPETGVLLASGIAFFLVAT